jgi:hypothetical protein
MVLTLRQSFSKMAGPNPKTLRGSQLKMTFRDEVWRLKQKQLVEEFGTQTLLPKHRTVYHTMPSDSQGFLDGWKGKPVESIVEQVREGSTLRVRMLISEDTHQLVTIGLAGIRSPRAAGREGETAEPWGEEVCE